MPSKKPEYVSHVTTLSDGRYGVDALGLAVRMGWANPDAATAAECYPLFELLPDEERPDPGEVVDGVPVFAWVAQEYAATLLRCTTRWVQDLEQKGLPNRGKRATKRYPLPHLVAWNTEYRIDVDRNGRCERLPFALAWARHRLSVEEDDAADDAAPPTQTRRPRHRKSRRR